MADLYAKPRGWLIGAKGWKARAITTLVTSPTTALECLLAVEGIVWGASIVAPGDGLRFYPGASDYLVPSGMGEEVVGALVLAISCFQAWALWNNVILLRRLCAVMIGFFWVPLALSIMTASPDSPVGHMVMVRACAAFAALVFLPRVRQDRQREP